MTTANSTASDRPAKPYPEYPLFPHSNGSWAKKIRGTLHYFGSWKVDSPDRGADAALEKYLRDRDDLHAGRTPRAEPTAVTVKDAANAFLNHKADKRDAGELSVRTWAKYKEVADLVVSHFGRTRLVADLRTDDFAALKNAMTKRWGPLRVADFIQHVRSVFKHAFDAELIDRPVRFGPGFDRPSQKTLRLHRAKQGPKLFAAAELRQLIDAASPPLKAMILLATNAGYGNADCAMLPVDALDLDGAVLDFARPKTGVARRCPLWPETVDALREVLADRPKPRDGHDDLVFLTVRGTPWVSVREKDRTDLIAVHFAALVKKIGMNGKKGRSFYVIRHTHRTVADETRDQAACDRIMGHYDPTMAGIYREIISDARLKAVTDHVREWLFGQNLATEVS